MPSSPPWRSPGWPTTDGESVAGHADRPLGDRRCRPSSPPGPGPALARQTGDEAAARGGRPVPARRARQSQGQASSSCPTTLLAWKVRAALARRRRQAALAAGDAGDRRDVAGRAEAIRPGSTGRRARLQALANDSQEGETLTHEQPASCSTGIAAQLNFYGQLAAEDLGQPQTLPPKPAPLTPAERDVVARPSRLRRARWR